MPPELMARSNSITSHLGVFLTLLSVASAALLRADPADQRIEACRFCGKLCPVSCFVGTCGLDYSFTVRKFQATNKCYSCDPGTSVGISKDGDFIRCSKEETGLSDQPGGNSIFSEPSPQQAVQQGPQGPAVSGDAAYHANLASTNAQTAMQAAENAAIHASKAAEAATARYREVSGTATGSGGSYSDMSQADMDDQHQMATQVRAEQALRTAEIAHIAWKTAMEAYNVQLAALRKQQILTDKAEKTLQAAEESSEKARGEYACMQSEAQKAMEAALASGGSAASRITARAAAEELAGTAQAAQQRLLIAAKEAKDAANKISIATTLSSCTPTLLQMPRAPGSPAIIGCESIAEEQLKTKKPSVPKITPLIVANRASPAQTSATNNIPQLSAMDEDGLQPLINEEPGATLEIPNIEQQLTQNLAQKLAENPAAVEDPSVFAAPTVPFTPEQMPIDGTESIPAFDLSTVQASGGMAALQRGDRRMLRHGKYTP
jgi:hypothetical protein|mmetsp:Transcript_93348/g.145616  ORF Transcript_93348/g.145616 Transcript_93348/m.145616 type:complete len:492 (-) Transcript_93348:25-1500(-)